MRMRVLEISLQTPRESFRPGELFLCQWMGRMELVPDGEQGRRRPGARTLGSRDASR